MKQPPNLWATARPGFCRIQEAPVVPRLSKHLNHESYPMSKTVNAVRRAVIP